MASEQLLNFIDTMYVQTFEGLVDWTVAVDDVSIQTSFEKESVIITVWNNTYSFRLMNSEGEIVYNVVESDWEKTSDLAHEKLARLYNLGRTKALGIDKIIERLNSEVSLRRK